MEQYGPGESEMNDLRSQMTIDAVCKTASRLLFDRMPMARVILKTHSIAGAAIPWCPGCAHMPA